MPRKSISRSLVRFALGYGLMQAITKYMSRTVAKFLCLCRAAFSSPVWYRSHQADHGALAVKRGVMPLRLL
jgi:hypothetical protein